MANVKQAEQAHLDHVISKIKLAELEAISAMKRAEKNERIIQKDYYNDVRIRSTTYTGVMDTGVEVRQKQQMLSQLNSEWRQAHERLRRYKRMDKNPYFARVDFTDEQHHSHTIYIGIASFSSDVKDYLIYDWRAPISSIYYENKMGPVTYQTPEGPKHVKITLKRQFQIKNGKIKTVFDTAAAIGDQLLLSNLSRHSTSKMRNIVSTIQREQNQVIRDTDSDLLYVQGAAGSGKTSAALQRVAYLLYHYRPALTSRQIILFSPNQLFNDYINHVLPSLGEHNMVRMTYYQYSNHRVPKFNVETLSQRFADDNLVDRNRNLNTLKNSLSFFKAEQRYIKDLNRSGMHFKNIMFNGKVLIPKTKIARIYYHFNLNYDLNNRLDATRTVLEQIIKKRIKSEMKKKWVSDAIEDMNRQQLRYIQLSHPNEFQNLDSSYDFLAKHIVIGAFSRVERIIKRNLFININLQYVHWLKNVPKYVKLSDFGLTRDKWIQSIKDVMNEMDYRSISMADVSSYLYLYDRIVGSLGHRNVKYVFVDEAQDYTAFQMAFFHFEFPEAKFTVLGDLNQAIFTHENSHSLFHALKEIFAGRKIRKIDLKKAYRSTRPITEFTKYLLPDRPDIRSFARSGILPQVFVEKNRGQELNRLANVIKQNQAAHETTAVIGKDLKECQVLYRQLQAHGVPSSLIQTENQRLVNGTLIVPAYLAKGLEFDAVVMWDASDHYYPGKRDWQLVYTICTRAMHRLDVIGIQHLAPLIQGVPDHLYHERTFGE